MRRRGFPVLLSGAVLTCVALCVSAHGQYYPNQSLEIHDLPSLTARTHDPTDVLLASLDTILHDRVLCCGKDSALIDSVQAADPKSLKDIANKLGGRHLLGDGRPIQMDTEFLTPDQVVAGHLVAEIVSNRAPLMIWNSQLYVVHGIIFASSPDYSTGITTYVIQKFLLWDLRYSDTRREVVFDREKEDPGKTQGILFVTLARQ
ncbi:MAG TPA: hypothetical protein VGS78_00170 [Candidatus Sulfotelmatobacter sp.]|nr:hypothetical protein [Candidatus Sulfotelmatobacter sp.]